jgi:hypothetical protein
MIKKIKIYDEGFGEYIYLTEKEYMDAFNDPYAHKNMSDREHKILDTF